MYLSTKIHNTGRIAFRFIILAFAAYIAPAQAASFDFSYTYLSGESIHGTFNGIAFSDGVFVDDGFTMYVNGNARHGMFSSSYDGEKWVTDNGYLSYTGLQNNFMFANIDFPDVIGPFNTYFYSIPLLPKAEAYDLVSTPSSSIAEVISTDRWSLTASSVPEPSIVVLIGLGLVALLRSKHRADLRKNHLLRRWF